MTRCHSKEAYSVSSLETAQQCLRRYQLKYIYGARRVSDDDVNNGAGFGKLAHMMCDVKSFINNKSLSDDEFKKTINLFDELAKKKDSDSWIIAKASLLSGYANNALKIMADEIVSSEEKFNVEIDMQYGDNYNSIGISDVVIKIGGKIWVVDYKFLAQHNDLMYWQNRIQGPKYVKAMESLLDEKVAGIVYIVIKKPQTKPLLVDNLDKDGNKIKIVKLDSDGNEVINKNGKPSMITDRRRENDIEYSSRLEKIINENYNEYIKTIVVSRQSMDMAAYEHDIDILINNIRANRSKGGEFPFPRSTGNCVKYNQMCDMADICNIKIDKDYVCDGYTFDGRKDDDDSDF